MAKCLLTRLDGAIENDSIPKIDELMIDYVVKATASESGAEYIGIFGYHVVDLITFRLYGDNYFTNSSGTENYGKEKSFKNDEYQTIYIKYNVPTIIFLDNCNNLRVYSSHERPDEIKLRYLNLKNI